MNMPNVYNQDEVIFENEFTSLRHFCEL